MVLALSFPLRYYAYLMAADCGCVAAAPLQPEAADQDRVAA
jgi:hypothetical protein